MFRRRPPLEVGARAAMARLLEAPQFELVPLTHAIELADLLPAGALVSVTVSPSRGIEPTIDLCERLEASGFDAVPHLSAHSIHDRAQLAEVLARLAAAGIGRAFVVGGDGPRDGQFADGLALLRAMAELGATALEIGIPCYPQGHPSIPNERLLDALVEKSPFAHYMTTQMCFDPEAVARWITARRADGQDLPVYLGVPGAVEVHKLLAMSARIGVSDSRRFVAKNVRLVGRLLMQPTGFRPDALLDGLAPIVADPAAGVRGLHLYTFNQVAATEAWRQRYLAAQAAALTA